MSKYDKYSKNFLNTDIFNAFDGHTRWNGRRFRRVNPQQDFKFTAIFSIIFILVLIISLGMASRPPEIARSTKAREKLSLSSKLEKDCIYDVAGIIDSESALKEGLSYFCDNTGISPCVCTVSSIYKDSSTNFSEAELDSYTETSARELFPEGDRLVVFIAKKSNGSYMISIYAGSKTREFLDSEAQTILKNCFEHYIFIEKNGVRYKDDNFSLSNALKESFTDSANRLTRKDTPPWVYVSLIAGGVLLLVIAIVNIKRKVHRTGKLKVEKEYLPGEYIPASVMRTSDTDNASKGISYRYGSEAVAGDIPQGVLLTHDMLHPKKKKEETPTPEMESVYIPKGVMLNPGAGVTGFDMPAADYSGFGAKPKQSAQTVPNNVPYRDNNGNPVFMASDKTFSEAYNSFGDKLKTGSVQPDESRQAAVNTTIPYRDSNGNTVMMNDDKNFNDAYNKWAEYYNLNKGDSAFVDEEENFDSSTAVYRDMQGMSHLLKNNNDEE